MRGLIIREPWITLILDGKKTWEIRGSNTKIRGEIGLIRSQSGLVVGTAELVDCLELTLEEYQATTARHCIENTSEPPYRRIFAWELTNPKRYISPTPYQHPQGAVIWVKL